MHESREPAADLSIDLMFPRVHRAALGTAVGLTGAAAIFLLTAFHLLAGRTPSPLGLLSQYFLGYRETWSGAFIGAGWMFGVGFAWGWLLGLAHNLNLDIWLMLIRAKTDLTRTRNVLDQLR
jgi:hypothetical protein